MIVTREPADVIARARRLANDMARHIIGENDPTGAEEACARCVDLAIAALSDAAQGTVSGWQPIATAPKDGTPVLIQLKNPLPEPSRTDLDRWHGRCFVGAHNGVADDAFDIGWHFAAPVGQGGFPDRWIAGWCALPLAALSGAAAQADALTEGIHSQLTSAERVIEAARAALEHVEAVLSIGQPRSHTREYLETLDQVRGVLATIAETLPTAKIVP